MHKGIRISGVFGIWVDNVNRISLIAAGHQELLVTNYHPIIITVKLAQCAELKSALACCF